MLYNDKQNEVRCYNRDHRPRVILCDGAVGSGKTKILMSTWIENVYRARDKNQDHILTGYTMGTLERNILRPLKDDFGIDAHMNQENVFQMFGNRMNCFGTDKAHSWKSIRGIETAYSHYANELTLNQKSSVDEAANRCRGQGARYFYETNPEGQGHFVYQQFILPTINNGNSSKLARFNFTLYDNDKKHNGFLPDEYIQQQEERYSGVLRRKLVGGEWCSIEGQIYYLEQLQFYDDSDTRLLEGGTTHGYLDPAAGSQKKTGCFTSLITGTQKGKDIYIRDAVVRKIGIAGIIQAAGELLKRFNYSRLVYEDNFTQDEYVGKPLKEAYPFASIIGQSSREDKLSRLIGMQNTVQTKLHFPERWLTEKNSDGWLLLQQLTNITATRNENAESDVTFLDGPDALEGLIRTFTCYSGNGKSRAGGKKIEKDW